MTHPRRERRLQSVLGLDRMPHLSLSTNCGGILSFDTSVCSGVPRLGGAAWCPPRHHVMPTKQKVGIRDNGRRPRGSLRVFVRCVYSETASVGDVSLGCSRQLRFISFGLRTKDSPLYQGLVIW